MLITQKKDRSSETATDSDYNLAQIHFNAIYMLTFTILRGSNGSG